MSKSRATFILSNPFYIGLFKYGGERHEGRYEPIISKKLFDEAQEMLKLRGQPERKAKNEPQPFCGLVSCASCGMMITGEHKFKRQKNGNVHEYTYYRCTKKRKDMKCSESAVREKEMDRQLSSLIKSVSLPKDWADELNRMALEEHGTSAQSFGACMKEKQEAISTISIKLGRLLNGYLEQDIEREVYRAEKAKLLLRKKSLEEEMASLSHTQNAWLEPFQNWLNVAQRLPAIASDSDLFAKKVCAKEIFGSNLRLGGKVVAVAVGDSQNCVEKTGQNEWACLRHAHSIVSSEPLGSILVWLLYQVRTCFQNK